MLRYIAYNYIVIGELITLANIVPGHHQLQAALHFTQETSLQLYFPHNIFYYFKSVMVRRDKVFRVYKAIITIFSPKINSAKRTIYHLVSSSLASQLKHR